ncbi:hypothetical protein ASC74_13475 [Pseudomonas sp. Root329]|jgi:hypothetical protein|uniref:Uncharacterized protein n=1 Tax=Pseudomonas fluorescens TaxID=294 RepID=A0A0F4SRL8_PSEFL|nr:MULTISPECIES: hypothetical protein [Pseudomonas]KJZ34529.1 hypothetical protein VC34_28800 [Pseudomonas fluorescens]KQV10037.1 hypothetical protein ASC74_13475 [Pseudomonas sp. Root329]
MISNFEKALNRDELPEYFRGSGIYFTKDPDWGTQLHVINWQGLCGFLKTQKNPVATLKNAFEKYLKTITNSIDDANDLLENIGCYYYMRKKIPILSENGFDLIRDLSNNEKQIISNCMEFLHQETYKINNAQDIETYNRRITKLANDGGPKNFRNL